MLKVESDGPVLHLTLARPEVRNAFNDELIALLTETFLGISQGTRAVVVEGEGKGFCAGGDLEWMRKASAYTEEQNYQDALKLARLFGAITECPAVVIAKVHGAAFGGGCGLVAAADVAVASSEAKFSFSEVKLGLVPGTISRFVIPKIGAGHARALFSSGEIFGTEKALRIGLIHDVAEGEALEAMVQEKVRSVLASGPVAVAEAKRIAQEGVLSVEESARRLAKIRAGEEGKEGVAAFLEKRPAAYVVSR